MASPIGHVSRVVVVGAGLAGLRTAECLRTRGFDGEIVLVGEEEHPPYDRPPLSKQVLRGERDEPWLRSLETYAELAVQLRLGSPASDLDGEGRTLTVGNELLEFDVAVIATGAKPRRIPDLGGHTLRTLHDSLKLREKLVQGATLAVVGGGLIGCEVASSARALSVDVHLVDVLEGPMIRVVGPTVATLIANLHGEHGVHLRFGVSASRSDQAGAAVLLSDGEQLDADVVLEAAGVTPATGWLNGSGLSVDDGVVCDDKGRASIPHVFAVGDVASWDGRRAEHWTSASTQPDRVAAAILDQPLPSIGLPYWWSDQYDVKVQGLGQPAPNDEVDLVKWGPRGRNIAVYSRGGRVTGVVGFSATPAVMSARGDISAGGDVSSLLRALRGAG